MIPVAGSRPVFLEARWENLLLLNYPVEADLLEPLLPPGLALDLHEGKPHVSLVAFDFRETRVFGMSWPGFRHFPEINLRFYVRLGEWRGVVFVREFVPSRWVAQAARTLYNEPYLAVPFERSQSTADGLLHHGYGITLGGRRHGIDCTIDPRPTVPGPQSTEHFFKEHQWGFGKDRRGRLQIYEVEHPVWETCPVSSWRLSWDFEAVYGSEWSFLNGSEPSSVVFALGSPIRVRRPSRAGALG